MTRRELEDRALGWVACLAGPVAGRARAGIKGSHKAVIMIYMWVLLRTRTCTT
ncbi:MAG: hypothetical protein Ct9H300mP1_20530 [Planctomycetaceae bacterium]|nr:MAG: hypothetical protein Ct9H300mP1_20530 [Planctomycetaceae bacterium]